MDNTPNTPALSTTDVRTLLGLITEDEFGRAVGVVGPTIAIWRNRGEGPPFYRFKRNIFYRTADVVQWIIENTWDPANNELLIPPKPKPTIARITRGDGTLELSADDIENARYKRIVEDIDPDAAIKSTPQPAALSDEPEAREPSAV